MEPIIVTIFDVAGKIVAIHQLESSNNPIDISALKSGVYFVQIQNSKLLETSKFIKK